jgi:HSP20 family molecular chaperone IbpA
MSGRSRTLEVLPSSDDPIKDSLRQMLDNFLGGQRSLFCPSDKVWNPPTDIFETRNSIHIKLELAGAREEDIQVQVSDNYIVVRGRRCDEQHVKRENFHLMEIQYGTFERVFGLPPEMEIKDITAALQDGFLLITIPKDTTVRECHISVE